MSKINRADETELMQPKVLIEDLQSFWIGMGGAIDWIAISGLPLSQNWAGAIQKCGSVHLPAFLQYLLETFDLTRDLSCPVAR